MMLRIDKRAYVGMCLFLLIAFSSSCVEGPPAFVRGIRIFTLYDVVDHHPPANIMLIGPPPNAVIVSKIRTYGNSEGAPFGPASPGSGGDFDFDNESDRFGISDNPTIRDNMEWSISASYFFVVPGCGSVTRSFGIPPGGTLALS